MLPVQGSNASDGPAGGVECQLTVSQCSMLLVVERGTDKHKPHHQLD